MTKWGFNSRITFLKNLGKKCRETCISRLNQRNVILEESRFTCFSLKNIRELHNSRRERLNSRWLNYMKATETWMELQPLSGAKGKPVLRAHPPPVSSNHSVNQALVTTTSNGRRSRSSSSSSSDEEKRVSSRPSLPKPRLIFSPLTEPILFSAD